MIISSRSEPTAEKNCQRAADLGDKPSVTATEGAIANTSLACPLTQPYNTIPAAFTSGLRPDLGIRNYLRQNRSPFGSTHAEDHSAASSGSLCGDILIGHMLDPHSSAGVDRKHLASVTRLR